MWCNLMQNSMQGGPLKHLKVGDDLDSRSTVRASVGVPQELHAKPERITHDRKVSLAWVMRDAAEKYFPNQCPLLAQSK
jgi:hypothetical protein